MHDPGAMRVRHRIGDLATERDDLIPGQGAARDCGVEGRALDVLHGDKHLVVVLADVVDDADVGVAEGRGGSRFVQEAGAGLRVGGLEHLQRDVPAQSRVGGAVDDAHAAGAELLGDLVRAEAGAGSHRHGRLVSASV
jgi:hypothetical protein